MVPVFGDITQLRLGMYEEDIQRLSNVSVAFHLAASVRFDDPLRDAIKTNICSTQELFEMLKATAPQLRAVVHVSTAYSNPENRYVEEKVLLLSFNHKPPKECFFVLFFVNSLISLDPSFTRQSLIGRNSYKLLTGTNRKRSMH